MSLNNILHPNPYTLYSEMNITDSTRFGVNIANSLTINNDIEGTNTTTTTALFNAINAGGNLSGTLTPGQVPVCETDSHTLVNSIINATSDTITIGNGSTDPEFVVKNSSDNAFLDVNPASNYIKTLNNQLDSSSGQGQFLNLQVQPFNNNTSSFTVLTSANSSNSALVTVDTTDQIIQLGDGANLNPEFIIKNQYSSTVFDVDSSVGSVKSYLNVYDDGNGNVFLNPLTELAVKNSSGNYFFNVNASNNTVTIGDGSNNPEFVVKNSSSNAFLDVNPTSNYIKTLNNQLDSSSGQGQFLNLQVQPFSNNTTTFTVLTSASSTNAPLFTIDTTDDQYIILGDSSNLNPIFIINNQFGQTVFSVNSHTNSTNSWLNTLDDGTGQMILANNIYPTTTNSFSCGVDGNVWTAVYATNTTIQTSDENKKTSIKNEVLGLDFLNELVPVSYEWKDNKHKDNSMINRGLIAQQVESVLTKYNQDNTIVVKTQNKDGTLEYGMKYSELISPMIKSIQQLSQQNQEHQNDIKLLKKMVTDLLIK